MNSNKKKWLIPLVIGVAVLLVAGVAGFICFKTIILPKKQVEKYLAYGDAYHSGQDDENAILSYKAALEIDPDNENAYLGLADAYESLAGQYLALNMPEEGVNTFAEGIEELKKGCSATGSAGLQNRLSQLEGKEPEISEEADRIREKLEKQAVAENLQPVMDKIAELGYTNKWDEVFEYMQSEDYKTFLNERSKLGDRWIFTTMRGEIGFYKVKDTKYGEYMLYLGYYSPDGKRDGNADWFGFYDGNNYHGSGTWEDDVPQGYWEIQEWNTELNEKVVSRFISGYVIDGLLDGNISWSFDYKDDVGLKRRRCIFDHGKWVVTSGPDKDGNYTSATPNSWGITLSPEELEEMHGVVGYVNQ